MAPSKPTLSSDLEGEDLEAPAEIHRPESIEDLLARTKFTRSELKAMYRGFKQNCPTGIVEEDQFKDIICEFFPNGDAGFYVHHLFRTLDTGKTGAVTFEEFVVGLSVISRGSEEEKLIWCFSLYDADDDGRISREELTSLVHSVFMLLDEFGDFSHDIQNVVNRVFQVGFGLWWSCGIKLLIWQKWDLNQDGVVTREEFMQSCLQVC